MKKNFSTEESKKSGAGRGTLWLSIASVIGIFLFLGSRGFVGSEDRWAEVIREMLVTGDYFHPSTNFTVYFDKPLLSYWVVVLAAKIFGGMNEFVLRFPSAIFSLISIWSVYKTFSKLFSRSTGLLAGWMLLSSFGFLFWGRSAEADIGNMTMISLAYCWFVHCHDKAKFRHYLLFYMLLFVGALFKGIPAILVPVTAVLPFVVVHGEIKRNIKFSHFFALILASSIFFIAPLLAEYMPMSELIVWTDPLSALDLMWRENVVRAFNAFDHNDLPFYVYTYELQRVLLPWGVFYVLGLVWGVMNFRQISKNAKAVMLATLLIFLLFTISESKRWYYILPIAPFCMGFTAHFIMEYLSEQRIMEVVNKILRYTAAAVASLAVLTCFGWSRLSSMLEFELPALLTIGVPVVGALFLVILTIDEHKGEWLAMKLELPKNISTLVVILTVVMLSVFDIILPATDYFRTTKPFFLAHKNLLEQTPQDRTLFYSHDRSCHMLYYWDFQQRQKVVLQFRPNRDNPNAAEELQHSYDELVAYLRELSLSSGKIILVSTSKNMRYLEQYGIAESGEFRFSEPTFKEHTAPFESKTKRKFWIWVLEPDDINAIYENEVKVDE